MARRGIGLLFVLVVMIVMLAAPRGARADQPGGHTVPVAVLAFDSEDAEDNAEAITAALRSRVRQAQGWSLIETTQSLGMLTAALKCPTRPDPACQQRIAETLKAERYIFGYVTKGPQQGQVTAEIHLYQRGKADTVLRESYSDNLKDGNDDTLRKIASRIVERLGGAAVGVVVVRAGDQQGEVVVDGEKHVPLKDGQARIELAAGGHSIELAPVGAPATKRNVLVTAGRETVLEFTAMPAGGAPVEEKPFPTKKVVGGVTLAVGVGLAVVAVISAVNYSDAISKGEDRAKVAPIPPNVDKDTPCREYDKGSNSCDQFDSDAKKSSAIALVTGGVSLVALGVGAYLLFSRDGSSERASTPAAKATPQKPRARVVPSVGGLAVVGTF